MSASACVRRGLAPLQLSIECVRAVVPRQGVEGGSDVDFGFRQPRAQLVPEVKGKDVLVVQDPEYHF